MTSISDEDDYEQEENEFGSVGDLTSPEDMMPSKMEELIARNSMPPPSSMPLPQPILTPSQLIQPQMLSHM